MEKPSDRSSKLVHVYVDKIYQAISVLCSFLFFEVGGMGEGYSIYINGLTTRQEINILLFFTATKSRVPRFKRVCNQDIVVFYRTKESGFLMGFPSYSEFIEWVRTPPYSTNPMECYCCGETTTDINWETGIEGLMICTDPGNSIKLCSKCKEDVINSVIEESDLDNGDLLVESI